MKVTVKLFALLGDYLPAGAVDNAAELDVADGATPADIIRRLALPNEYCHLVLINGLYVTPGERDTRPLHPGDALAIWPPIAGGRWLAR
jgi:molybdopterin synthase sulfur carrier subunit